MANDLEEYKEYLKARQSIIDLQNIYDVLNQSLNRLSKYKHYTSAANVLYSIYTNLTIVSIQLEQNKQIVKNYEDKKVSS